MICHGWITVFGQVNNLILNQSLEIDLLIIVIQKSIILLSQCLEPSIGPKVLT